MTYTYYSPVCPLLLGEGPLLEDLVTGLRTRFDLGFRVKRLACGEVPLNCRTNDQIYLESLRPSRIDFGLKVHGLGFGT